MMQYSSGDMLGLIAELNTRRIAMVTGKMAKQGGGKFSAPQRVLDLLTTARRLHHRFMSGDYRHEPAEQDKIRDLCQWLVEQHDRLQGNAPEGGPRIIPWDAPALHGKQPQPKGTYQSLIGAVLSGEIDGDMGGDG